MTSDIPPRNAVVVRWIQSLIGGPRKHLLRFQKLLASYELLIVDEPGYVPLSKSGAELLFQTFSQRYERASTLVTGNLPFEEWTEAFGSKRLTGALLASPITSTSWR